MADPSYTEIVWAKNTRIKANPQEAWDAVQELDKACGGYAPVGALVERAREEDHVLHNEFEWDDTEAADKFRRSQENYIRRSFRIVTKQAPDMEPRVVRAQYPVSIRVVKDTQEKHTVWVGTKELLLSKEGREIILLRAEHELRSFVTKYDHLEELTVVEPIKLFLKKRAEERDGDGA